MENESLIEQSAEEHESVADGQWASTIAERKVDDIFQQFEREILGSLFFLCGGIEKSTLALFASLREKCRSNAQTNAIRNLRAWIFRSLFNEVSDYSKKRRKVSERKCEMDALATTNEVERLLFLRYEGIRTAILNLPFNERAVFILRQNGGLTYEQIAQTVSQPVADVKRTMNSVLVKLVTTLDELREMGRLAD